MPKTQYRKMDEYKNWYAMIQRCTNPKNRGYKSYGEKGISVCEGWRKSFLNFLNDMGKRPYKNWSIDRINNSKGYCKENCRWASPTAQVRNRGLNKNNNSGCSGVRFRKDTNKWESRIRVNYRIICLGSFATKEDAIAIRKEAEKKYWS